MAWDFCADQDFQTTLDWVQRFVDDELRPIEPLLPHLSPQQAKSLLEPHKEQVREQGLWAVHLPKDMGGNGFGQLPLAQMNLITGRVGLAMEVFGNMAPDSGNAELIAAGEPRSRRTAGCGPTYAVTSAARSPSPNRGCLALTRRRSSRRGCSRMTNGCSTAANG